MRTLQIRYATHATAVCCAFAMFASAAAPVAAGRQSAGTQDSQQREVTAAEAARTQAKRQGDTTRLRDLMAPDFIGINRFGRLLGRADAAALSANPNYATTDVQLRLYAGGAVVTGRESDEGATSGLVRFLRVWIPADRGWQELSDETTAIASEPAAARVLDGPISHGDRVVSQPGGVDANHVAGVPEAPADVARDVRQVERTYRAAERDNDLTALNRFRSAEYQLVDRLGVIVRPATESRPSVKTVQDDDFGVRVHGSIALAVGSVLRTDLESDATDRFRYCAVWIQRDGRWQVVAEQRTPIG